ncbi:ATP-binding protein [Streptomyces lavendulocolor]|uniref:ATP-binding protein n=1 Tax=Streptomyces lavendulocolor TaxID=67316 RepID=UPI003408B7FE
MSHATAFEPTAVRLLPETPRAFEVAIAPDPARVAQIRRITAASMRHWAVPTPLAYDVVVAVSELVTNAIEHGYGTVSLRVRNAGAEVRVEVTDDNPAPARLQAAAEDDVSGRGLFLVAVLAREWGVSEDGRTTWVTFRVPAGRT